MRRWALWGTMWLFGTTGSVAIGWLGVMVVAEEVTERPPAPLTERAVSRQATMPVVPPGDQGQAAEPVEAGPAPSEGTPAQSPPQSGFSPSAPVRRPPGAGPVPAPPNRATQGRRPPSSPAPVRGPEPNPPPPDPAPPAPPPRTKTISSRGGTVSVRYDEGTVTLLWASPNAGFTMDIKASGPEEVDVRFASESHRSRIKAWWENAPRHSVREFRS